MKRGFTLAEILVTLGIIGVVASITMPSLTQNYQSKVYTAQLKKAYMSIASAYDMYMAENGITSMSQSPLVLAQDQTERDRILREEIVEKYFKVGRDCGNRAQHCFADIYRSIDKSKTVDVGANGTCNVVILTVDGMALCFDHGVAAPVQNEQGQQSNNAAQGISGEIDINGPEGPNISGRDMFQYTVTDNGTIVGTNGAIDRSVPWADGRYLNRLLNNGWKMDY